MNKTLMRISTLALLLMVSMGANGEVRVDLGGQNNDGVYEGGTITASQSDVADGKVTVTLTVTPKEGYTITRKAITLQYTTLGGMARTRADGNGIGIGVDFYPDGDDNTYSYPNSATYTVKVEDDLGLSVKGITFSPSGAKGGSSGTFYFIKNNNNNQEWALCISNHNYNGDASMPYLRTKQYPNAYEIWEVRPDGEYYNIIHHADGKYIVANATTQVAQAVHLETIADISALDASKRQAIQFEIVSVSSTAYAIRPRGADSKLSFNPANGNGTDAGKDGTKGDIQLYPGTNSAAMQWVFEATVPPPAISCNKTAQTFTLTAPKAGTTVRYTTDGSIPTATNGTEYTTPIPANGVTVVKAVAVDGDKVSPVAELYSPLVSFAFEHKVTDGYYMYPIDDADGDGNPYLHTYSLPRPGMTWHLEPGELVFGVQHYHFVNDETNRYLWFSSSAASVPVLKTTADGDDFQLSLTPISGDDGYFGVASKPTVARWLTNYRYYLNKANNYDANNTSYVGSTNATITSSLGNGARWRMKALTSATPREDLESAVPFTVSDNDNTHYYKLFAQTATSYYLTSPARTTGIDSLAKTSNVVSDNQAWLIKVASTDDWATYYHIVNAVTGEYLYYVGDIDNVQHDNAFITRPISSATEETADRYQFAMAPTTTVDRSFIVPKPVRYLNNKMAYNTVYCNNSNNVLHTRLLRNDNASRWGFTAAEMTVAPPVITQNAAANTVTLATTTAGATIHYTTDGTTPTESSPTYSSAIPLTSHMAEIKAVAIKGGTPSTISTHTVLPLTGISNQYMIQNQEFTDFYLLPGSRQNDGFRSANTYSLLRPSMTWTFVASERYDNRQYYALRNDSTGCYLSCYLDANNNGVVRLKTSTDYGDGSADEFKFTFIQKDDGSYWIVPKERPAYSIHKDGGNNSNSTKIVTTSNSATSTQCRWKFVRHDQLSAPTMPFTVSDDNCAYYYRIKNANANTFYIVPNNGSNEYANTSEANSTNDRWFIREVANDEWLTYYAIINAETGQCLYFNGNGTTAAINNAFISRSLTTSEMATADAAQFAIARTTQSASDGYYYLVPKMVRYTNNCDNYSLVWRDGTNALKTQLQRDNAQRKWIFETSTFKCTAPTLTQDMVQGIVTITASNALSRIYYVGYDDEEPELTPENGTLYTDPIAIQHQYYKAIVSRCDDGSDASDAATLGPLATFRCATPKIIFNSATRMTTITCETESATIYYILDREFDAENPLSGAILYTGPFSPYTGDTPQVVRAIAIRDSETGTISEVAVFDQVLHYISSTDEITSLTSSYAAKEGFSVNGTIGDADHPFTGTFDGAYVPITLSAPLFAKVDGATVKNVRVSSATVSGDGHKGVIVNEATGTSRIYNCGVIEGSVTSNDAAAGGIVGHIAAGSSVRVVNCYNFATIKGSTHSAGIVGWNEGTVDGTTTVTGTGVRIANCMMYGDMTEGAKRSPVYCGNHTNNQQKLTEYNFYRSHANLTYTDYNDQLAIGKDEYLDRFPFYRHILNTHRELAAYFLFADHTESHVNEIGHWVLNTAVAPYPIVEPWEINTKRMTEDIAANLPNTTEKFAGKLLSSISSDGYYRGDGTKVTTMGSSGNLAVTVKIGNKTFNASLPITDMDTLRYDFTWGKVVLPHANEFSGWTRDYDYVCTGWKITSVTKDGSALAAFNIPSSEPYNFADRDNAQKDIYNASSNPYVFAQGGNYIVPYGVTAITIEAHFAKAFYLSDPYSDVGYKSDYTGATDLGWQMPTTFHGKTVYTSLNTLVSALSTASNPNDQAIVLVGNFHHRVTGTGDIYLNNTKAVTIMSCDEDNNQEPDYAWYMGNTYGRMDLPPIRFDVPNIEIGMAAHVKDSKGYPGAGIWHVHGWFELTENSLNSSSQFEINSSKCNSVDNGAGNNRWIANSGCFVQVVRCRASNCYKLSYIQVGGNAYIKELYPGSHTDDANTTTSVPIMVNGGQVDECYMTGYNAGAKLTGDMIYFWSAGGKIEKWLGSYLEDPSTAGVTAKIDHARIYRFFGGGTSSAARVKGDIDITINNTKVDFYCGGPEFGDMYEEKTLTTHATGTTFGEYYGAGFGGTSITYNREAQNQGDAINAATHPYPLSFTNNYKRLTIKSGYGIGTCYKFEYIYNSNATSRVSRFYTGYAQFSLAETRNVTNVLNNCTFDHDFYGAGCQGKVNGTVTSTLTNCTVKGSAYGGGFKAEANEVSVYPATQPTYSVYTTETGLFSDFGTVTPETYNWIHGDAAGSNTTNKTLTTTTDMSELGNVTGDISLTIVNGSVGANVFGGGNESPSNSNTSVTLRGSAQITGNVFGGGNNADVGGTATVNIEE